MNVVIPYSRPLLERELVRDEGERLRAYLCSASKWTIGVGRNLDDVGISAAETKALGITVASARRDGITRVQSRALLGNDIDGCERDLDRRLPWWRTLDDVRQRVLLNMCFNLGITRLLGFVNTLKAVRDHDWRRAHDGMLASKWAGQVGVRADRLAAMMLTGLA